MIYIKCVECNGTGLIKEKKVINEKDNVDNLPGLLLGASDEDGADKSIKFIRTHDTKQCPECGGRQWVYV